VKNYEITTLEIKTNDEGELVPCGVGEVLMAFETGNDDAAVRIFDHLCKARTPRGYQEHEADFNAEMGEWELIATRENPEGHGYALWR